MQQRNQRLSRHNRQGQQNKNHDNIKNTRAVTSRRTCCKKRMKATDGGDATDADDDDALSLSTSPTVSAGTNNCESTTTTTHRQRQRHSTREFQPACRDWALIADCFLLEHGRLGVMRRQRHVRHDRLIQAESEVGAK